MAELPDAICTAFSPATVPHAPFSSRLGADSGEVAYEQQIEATLDALADHLERSLDLAALLAAARPPRLKPAV